MRNTRSRGLAVPPCATDFAAQREKEHAMKSAAPEDEARLSNEQKTRSENEIATGNEPPTPPENAGGPATPPASAPAWLPAPGTCAPAIPTPDGQTATF